MRAVREMRSLSIILITCWLNAYPYCAVAKADGGRVVLMERQGDRRISVFTSPDPLRAGPVDISVLLQDAETGQPITNVPMNVALTLSGRRGPTIRAVAKNDAATNKLLSAALVELPAPGSWDVEISCLAELGADPVRFTIDAGEQSAVWTGAWPWFVWPAGVVILFGIHLRLVARRKAAPSPIPISTQRLTAH
jgi:hypothetical protein